MTVWADLPSLVNLVGYVLKDGEIKTVVGRGTTHRRIVLARTAASDQWQAMVVVRSGRRYWVSTSANELLELPSKVAAMTMLRMRAW